MIPETSEGVGEVEAPSGKSSEVIGQTQTNLICSSGKPWKIRKQYGKSH